MGKASFSKGFAAEKLSEGRAPMVARLNTTDTIIDFETSFPADRAWPLYRFIHLLADKSQSPEKAFKEAFTSHAAPRQPKPPAS